MLIGLIGSDLYKKQQVAESLAAISDVYTVKNFKEIHPHGTFLMDETILDQAAWLSYNSTFVDGYEHHHWFGKDQKDIMEKFDALFYFPPATDAEQEELDVDQVTVQMLEEIDNDQTSVYQSDPKDQAMFIVMSMGLEVRPDML